jgi:hypothetical protein
LFFSATLKVQMLKVMVTQRGVEVDAAVVAVVKKGEEIKKEVAQEVMKGRAVEEERVVGIVLERLTERLGLSPCRDQKFTILRCLVDLSTLSLLQRV